MGKWVALFASSANLNFVTRTILVFAGLYFPIFFVQLNAIKNGIDPELAFYTVSAHGRSFGV